MANQEIEVILSRQLADCLSIPMFITDPEGNLLFFNEPAEDILGKRFEDTGPLALSEWAVIFNPEDEKGQPFPVEELPLVKTLSAKQPYTGNFWIESLDGDKHYLSVTSMPLRGRANRYVGAIAIFWTNETRKK